MNTDELHREDGRWWYTCTCGYTAAPPTIRGATLIRGVHRHRHLMGTAGLYHVRQTEQP